MRDNGDSNVRLTTEAREHLLTAQSLMQLRLKRKVTMGDIVEAALALLAKSEIASQGKGARAS